MSFAITAKVIVAGAAAYSASDAHDTASKATSQSKSWRKRAIAEQQRQFDLGREDLAPYRELGYNAINNLEDPDAYQQSPGYQFRLDEGNRAAENLWSMKQGGGNAMRALTEYNSDFASKDYYDYRNDQRANAGLGQAATNYGVGVGQANANAQSGIYQSAGQDLASIGMWGGVNQTNAITGGISNLLYGAKNTWGNTAATGSTNAIDWDDFKG